MDKSHPLFTLMVEISLTYIKITFRSQKNDEEFLGDETPYFSVIVALMYLANNTRATICFAISLLARFNSFPTKRH